MGAGFNNTMVLLTGFAGTGKYTIGRELCQRTGAKLLDNHLINNPIFTVVDADGVKPLPAGVWDKIKVIRRVVYEAMAELSPGDLSFVLTMELRESDPRDHAGFADLVNLAVARQSLFIPIRLICDTEELCRRVVNLGRAKQRKELSPENARRKSAEDAVLNPHHPNLRTIDVTAKSPAEAADVILQEIDFIRASL